MFSSEHTLPHEPNISYTVNDNVDLTAVKIGSHRLWAEITSYPQQCSLLRFPKERISLTPTNETKSELDLFLI